MIELSFLAKKMLSTKAIKAVPTFVGEVIGTKMIKTVKVRVEKIKMHPIVQKVWFQALEKQKAQF